jgi:hypothetical protein
MKLRGDRSTRQPSAADWGAIVDALKLLCGQNAAPPTDPPNEPEHRATPAKSAVGQVTTDLSTPMALDRPFC